APRTAIRFFITATPCTTTARTAPQPTPMARASAASGSSRRPTWRRPRRRVAAPTPATRRSTERLSSVRGRDRRHRLGRRVGQHLQRVDRAVLDPHLEVGVRSGGVAGRADQTDQLTPLNLIAFLDTDRQEMAIEGLEPGVVLDDDVVPVTDQCPGGVGHRA